jgi:hypothetical protein
LPQYIPNGRKIDQHLQLQVPPKFTQISIFVLKICHLATPCFELEKNFLCCSFVQMKTDSCHCRSTAEGTDESNVCIKQGDQMCFRKKTVPNLSQPVFAKINSQLFLRKRVAQKFGLLLQFSKNCPKQRISRLVKFAQSGHPDNHL